MKYTIGERVSGLELKDWFRRTLTLEELNVLCNFPDFIYQKETEKAILFNIVGRYGSFTRWIPKSAILTEQEKAIRRLKEEANWQAYLDRQAKGLEKYEKLLEFAKGTGVPGIKKRMKTATIKNILAEAGIKIPRDLL